MGNKRRSGLVLGPKSYQHLIGLSSSRLLLPQTRRKGLWKTTHMVESENVVWQTGIQVIRERALPERCPQYSSSIQDEYQDLLRTLGEERPRRGVRNRTPRKDIEGHGWWRDQIRRSQLIHSWLRRVSIGCPYACSHIR